VYVPEELAVSVYPNPYIESEGEGHITFLNVTFGSEILILNAAGQVLPEKGLLFVSVKDSDKQAALPLARRLAGLGFKLMATAGTQRFLEGKGLAVRRVNKVQEGPPHCVDAITAGEIQLIINTTAGAEAIADSYSIRRSALVENVPHYTTMTGASAAVRAIEALRRGSLEVAPLQAYFEASF